jgi:phosphate starvation-inducible membrane PsiE
MKRSTGFFVLAGTWILVALTWIFVSHNVVSGIIWLVCALVELVIGLVLRQKEKKK